MINKKHHSKSGFALATVVMAMVLAMIVIPVLYQLTERDTKWAVQTKHSSLSIELATAGLDRALWKLKETNENWYYILSTGPLTGYNNDIDYTDVSEDGVYRVIIATTGNNNELLVTSTAKDKKGTRYRAVQAMVKRTQVSAALMGYNLVNSSNTHGEFTVHWGPIYDTGDLMLNTIDINQMYPRKYAVGSIKVFNSTGGIYSTRDEDPEAPNNSSEYYAYQTLPPVTTPDFDYYRAIAQANGTYYTSAQTLTSLVTGPGQVYYFEKKAVFKNADKFVQGVIIAEKTLDLRGNNNGVSAPEPNDYTVTPAPGSAYLEYQVNTPANKNAAVISLQPDTSLEDQYPGDGGLAITKDFQFGSTDGGASGTKPSFKGFVYVGTKLKGNSKRQVIHGALSISKNATIESGVIIEIFFDPTIEIRTASSDIFIEDWEEIQPAAF